MNELWYHCVSDGHLGTFYFGAIMHRAFLNILAHLYEYLHSLPLVTSREVTFLRYRSHVCSLIADTSESFSKWFYSYVLPAEQLWVSVASSLHQFGIFFFTFRILLLVSWYLILPSTAFLWVCFLLWDATNPLLKWLFHLKSTPAMDDCSHSLQPHQDLVSVIFFTSHCDGV